MARSTSKRAMGALTAIFACLLAVAVATLLTGLAHFLAAMGMNPETVSGVEPVAPILGIIFAAAWFGVRSKRFAWLSGLSVGILMVVVYFAIWCWLMGRFSPILWLRQGVHGLTNLQFINWAVAVAAGLFGGLIAPTLRKRSFKRWTALIFLILLAVPASMGLLAAKQMVMNDPLSRKPQFPLGMTLKTEQATKDGTVARLFTFDFDQEPEQRVDLFDADSYDTLPKDDQNATWLGTPSQLALEKLRTSAHKRGREVACLFNAGFFNMGEDSGLMGGHVAPIVLKGKQFYNVGAVTERTWTFGIKHKAGLPQFKLARKVPWDDLPKEFDTAISLVRPLLISGKPSGSPSALGVPRLKCSRTSIGWDDDSRRFYVLIVRDPDGWAGSIRQMESGQRQTGGWDVAQVRNYWQKRGVPNAVLLGLGDLTQVAYKQDRGYVFAGSGYLASRTLGYFHNRPIRFFIPMLPAEMSHNGVMNYLFVTDTDPKYSSVRSSR